MASLANADAEASGVVRTALATLAQATTTSQRTVVSVLQATSTTPIAACVHQPVTALDTRKA